MNKNFFYITLSITPNIIKKFSISELKEKVSRSLIDIDIDLDNIKDIEISSEKNKTLITLSYISKTQSNLVLKDLNNIHTNISKIKLGVNNEKIEVINKIGLLRDRSDGEFCDCDDIDNKQNCYKTKNLLKDKNLTFYGASPINCLKHSTKLTQDQMKTINNFVFNHPLKEQTLIEEGGTLEKKINDESSLNLPLMYSHDDNLYYFEPKNKSELIKDIYKGDVSLNLKKFETKKGKEKRMKEEKIDSSIDKNPNVIDLKEQDDAIKKANDDNKSKKRNNYFYKTVLYILIILSIIIIYYLKQYLKYF